MEEIKGDCPPGFMNSRPKSHIAMTKVCDEMVDFLITKNIKYGDSAFKDTKINGELISARQGILIRIADKVKRLTDGSQYQDEDTFKDLLGYLVILFAEEKIRNGEI